MELDIKLSINKKIEAQHNTYILRWNPTTSPYTMEQFDYDMNGWAQGLWSKPLTWMVGKCDKIRKGDRLFIVHTGEENPGIFAAGRFTSTPELFDEESGEQTAYIELETVFHPERAEIVSIAELKREIAHIDWLANYSAELLNKEDAVRVELMWRDYVGQNKRFYLPRAVKNKHYDSRSDIDKAIALASKAHAADYDLDGNPTILHPLAVGMMGTTDTERIIGFLHDVVEDTEYSFADLVEQGFSEEVIAALQLLTHDKSTPYMEYVERICRSGNRAALNVKINDLRHNIARGSEGGHMRCVEKHNKALAFIQEYLRANTI